MLPLQIAPGRRRRLDQLSCAAHALAGAAVMLADLPWLGSVLLLSVTAFSLLMGLVRSGRHGLQHGESRGWSTVGPNGQLEPLAIGDSTVVTPWFVALRGTTPTGRYAQLFLRGDLDEERFRELRVRLRATRRPSLAAIRGAGSATR